MPILRASLLHAAAVSTALALALAGLPSVVHASPATTPSRPTVASTVPAFAPEEAAPPADAPADEKMDAESLALKEIYDEADVAFLAGRYLDAAAKFDLGYARSKMVAFLFNAAVAWERGGQLEQAAERYAEYLVKAPTAEDHGEITDRLTLLRAAIAGNKPTQVAEVKTKGVAIFTSDPPGAEIRLDSATGPLFAVTPFRGTLPDGEHVVHITAPGFKPVARAFPDSSGRSLVGHFALSEEFFLGQLQVKSTVSGANVFLQQISDPEGRKVEEQTFDPKVPVGQTPFSNQIAPGRWELRVEKEGYRTVTKDFELPQGKIETVSVAPQLIDGAIIEFKAATKESIGAVAYLGKRELCAVPCTTEVPPGTHNFTVKMKKKKRLEFEVAVAQADKVSVDVAMEPATKRYPALVTAILMGGTAATGIIFAKRAKALEEEIQADLDDFVQFDQEDTRGSTGKRDAIIADCMFGATAILGALTIYYLARQTGEPSRGDKVQKNLAGRAIVTPTFSERGVGVAGALRF